MVEHVNEVSAVTVVMGIALVMIGAGLAKKQLDWRPLERRVRRGLPTRRRGRLRRKVSATLRGCRHRIDGTR